MKVTPINMTRKFLIALEAVSNCGYTSKGNSVLELGEGFLISTDNVDKVKQEYCNRASKILDRIFPVSQCMVFAIIPLEA